MEKEHSSWRKSVLRETDNLEKDHLSDLQFQGLEQAKKVEEVRLAQERVNAALAGLKYSPMSDFEEKRLAEFTLKDEKGFGVLDSKKLSKNLLSARLTTRIPVERLNELIDRENSIRYLISESLMFDGGNREYLQDARFFTPIELLNRSKERLHLIEEALKDITSQSGQKALLALAKYGIEGFFKIDDAGKVVFIDSLEICRKKLAKGAAFENNFIDEFSNIIKESRTGIEAGFLLLPYKEGDNRPHPLQKHDGKYCHGEGNFKGDLYKTGLIVMSDGADAELAKHEYAHFEHIIFRKKGIREGANEIINEINSFFLDLKESFLKENVEEAFSEIKKYVFSQYLRDYYKESDRKSPDYMSKENLAFAKELRNLVIRAINTVKKLYENGFSRQAISSILTHANTFDDILQWEKVPDEEIKKLSRGKK